MRSPSERRELLKAVYEEARGCVACPLHQSRTQVVFGAGHADADLMFIGEAPGANEDRMGLPFVGQAGKLLDRLLGEIGMERREVFIANTIKCRPPDNRDPQPHEIATCQGYLFRQLDLIQPIVVCTLGNFATKLLRNDPTGISRLRGRAEVRTIGPRAVRLLPLLHPAAALYTPSNLETLREDFALIPGLLALGPPPQPEHLQDIVEHVPEVSDHVPEVGEHGPEVAVGSEDLEVVARPQPATTERYQLGRDDPPGKQEQLGLF